MSNKYTISTISMRCRRERQEDRYTQETLPKCKWLFAGIFDGHGGSAVAEICKRRMGTLLDAEISSLRADADDNDYHRSISNVNKRLDRQVAEYLNTGSTTSIVLFSRTHDIIVFGNLGDSMAIIVYRDGSFRMVSREHKVGDPREMARIRDSGGVVSQQEGDTARLFNNLNVSRAIGDHEYKPWVINEPHVEVLRDTSQNIDCVVNASDGLWDVVSPADVAASVYGVRASQRRTCLQVLVDMALARGSMDNITISMIKPLDRA